MYNLPKAARPDSIRLIPGITRPLRCLDGLPPRCQMFFSVETFDLAEHKRAERWLELNFRGQDYHSEEKSQQEQRQDVQLSFLK